MINWLNNLDPAVQAAIVTGIFAIVVAIIGGIFTLLAIRKKKKNENHGSHESVTIHQSSSGHHNTFIGVQNNYEKGDE